MRCAVARRTHREPRPRSIAACGRRRGASSRGAVAAPCAGPSAGGALAAHVVRALRREAHRAKVPELRRAPRVLRLRPAYLLATLPRLERHARVGRARARLRGRRRGDGALLPWPPALLDGELARAEASRGGERACAHRLRRDRRPRGDHAPRAAPPRARRGRRARGARPEGGRPRGRGGSQHRRDDRDVPGGDVAGRDLVLRRSRDGDRRRAEPLHPALAGAPRGALVGLGERRADRAEAPPDPAGDPIRAGARRTRRRARRPRRRHPTDDAALAGARGIITPPAWRARGGASRSTTRSSSSSRRARPAYRSASSTAMAEPSSST